jgi:hypothetical protein
MMMMMNGSRSRTKIMAQRMMSSGHRHVRRPFVGGNWKCNPKSLKEVDELCDALETMETNVSFFLERMR